MINYEETSVMGYLLCRPRDRSMSLFDIVPASDRQTDRCTDIPIVAIYAYLAVCIASFGDARFGEKQIPGIDGSRKCTCRKKAYDVQKRQKERVRYRIVSLSVNIIM